MARGCCQRQGVAIDRFPERQTKTQLQGKLRSLDPGKLVFWPGCHGDRQAAAAREEGPAASPTSRIETAMVGEGLGTYLSPPDTEVPVCPPTSRLAGSGELPGSQKETWQRWLLKPQFSASRPVPSRCPTVASCSAFGDNRPSSAELLGPRRVPKLPLRRG